MHTGDDVGGMGIDVEEEGVGVVDAPLGGDIGAAAIELPSTASADLRRHGVLSYYLQASMTIDQLFLSLVVCNVCMRLIDVDYAGVVMVVKGLK